LNELKVYNTNAPTIAALKNEKERVKKRRKRHTRKTWLSILEL
jgi:hypothetical protein